jgi:hypothetical protein
MQIAVDVGYSPITCFKCGITFAVPTHYQVKRLEDGESFWCPNGHSQAYCESTVKRLEREKAKLVAQLDQRKAEAEHFREERDATERRLKATKGVVTRIKNRVAGGICPCCDKGFADLRDHMREAHPDYEHKPDESEATPPKE